MALLGKIKKKERVGRTLLSEKIGTKGIQIQSFLVRLDAE